MLGTIGFISFIGFSLGFLRVGGWGAGFSSRRGMGDSGISSHCHKPDRAPILKIRAETKDTGAPILMSGFRDLVRYLASCSEDSQTHSTHDSTAEGNPTPQNAPKSN